MRISFLQIFTFLLLCWNFGFAQNVLELETGVSRQAVHQHFDYFIDDSKSVTIDQLLISDSLFFNPAPTENFLRLGVTSATIWLKTRIRNSQQVKDQLIVHFEDPSLFDVRQFEIMRDGLYNSQYSGISVKPSEKPISGNEIAFSLSFDPGDEKVLYYRIESNNFISLPVTLVSLNRFYNETRVQRLLQGIYYGIILWIIVLSLYFYYVFKKGFLIFYAFSVLFLALITGIYDGITPEIFHRLVVNSNGYYESSFSVFSNIFSLLFMINFLSLKRNAHRIYQAAIALMISMLLILLYGFIDPSASLQLVSLFSIPVMITMIVGGYVGVRKKVGLAGYFLAAYLVTGVAVTIAILSLFDLITYNYYIKYVLHVGFLINIIILAAGLNGKINQIRREFFEQEQAKEKMKQEIIEQKNRELEEQIAERTKDIKEQEINLRAILDNNTNDAIWLVNTDFELIDFNSYMKLNFEGAYGTVIDRGANILEQIPDEKLKALWKDRYVAALQGNPGVYFDQYPTVEDDFQYFQINTYPIRFSTKVIGVSVYARNITGLKLSQEELKNRNDELEKLNKELDRFVYSASHDLKAPLSSILGLINIIRQEEDERNREELIKMMELSIQKLNRFIKDIENYSRNTRTELEKTEFNLYDLIQSIFKDLEFLEGASELTYKVNFEGNREVFSDEQRLNMILSNLINNAIRYSLNYNVDKETMVIVNTITTDAHIRIEITDNGPGISDDHLSQIFEMFYRVDENISGTGLGLYIVKETVNKLDGKIDVESEVGNGTTFRVEIPNS